MPRIGLISDTHGLMRPEALACMQGSDYIVHAGDICDPAVLEQLATIAPVTAVRGNNDHGPWAERLPETAVLLAGGILVYAIHDLAQLDIGLDAQKIDVVVSGHSHKPHVERRDGILYVNPGSSGPRRFKLPVTVGELIVGGQSVSARIFELKVNATRVDLSACPRSSFRRDNYSACAGLIGIGLIVGSARPRYGLRACDGMTLEVTWCSSGNRRRPEPQCGQRRDAWGAIPSQARSSPKADLTPVLACLPCAACAS